MCGPFGLLLYHWKSTYDTIAQSFASPEDSMPKQVSNPNIRYTNSMFFSKFINSSDII